MGIPGSRCAVLLALLLGAAAAVAARPCSQQQGSADALLDVLPLFAADDMSKGNTLGPLQHHADCKARCNDEEAEDELNTECWGTHLLVCKGNSSIMATKCEGHFLGFHVLDKHMYVAVCEGLSHKFGHWHTTCHKTGRTKRHFVGKGCLGEGSAIIRVHPGSNGSDASTTVAAALQSGVTIPSDPAMDALAAQLRKSVTHTDALHAVAREDDDDDDEDDHEYKGASFESRCKGRGGDVFGVKWGGHDDDDDKDVLSMGVTAAFYRLQASVTEDIGDIPEDLQLGRTIPTSVQQAAGRLSDLELDQPLREQEVQNNDVPKPHLEAAERVVSTPLVAMVKLADAKPRDVSDRPSCSLTCNGKTPWLKGKWPCYGELEVSCDADAPGGKTMEFSASCKGLWTGMFGKMCWGLTLQHSAKTWPSGCAHMHGICSGKQGIWSHKAGGESEGVFAMGQWCRGGAVGHGAFVKHDDEDVKLVAAV